MPDLLFVKKNDIGRFEQISSRLISEYSCSCGNNKVPGDVLANQQKEIHFEDRIRRNNAAKKSFWDGFEHAEHLNVIIDIVHIYSKTLTELILSL